MCLLFVTHRDGRDVLYTTVEQASPTGLCLVYKTYVFGFRSLDAEEGDLVFPCTNSEFDEFLMHLSMQGPGWECVLPSYYYLSNVVFVIYTEQCLSFYLSFLQTSQGQRRMLIDYSLFLTKMNSKVCEPCLFPDSPATIGYGIAGRRWPTRPSAQIHAHHNNAKQKQGRCRQRPKSSHR